MAKRKSLSRLRHYYKENKKLFVTVFMYFVVLTIVIGIIHLPKISSTISGVEHGSNTMLFLGDIMLGRYVENLRIIEGDDYPFYKIGGFLRSFDYVVANLEGPIPRVHKKTPSGSFVFSFDSGIPDVLTRNNIKYVSFANNHSFDSGRDDFLFGVNLLSGKGVMSGGSYDNKSLSPFVSIHVGKEIVHLGMYNFVGSQPLEQMVTEISNMRNEVGDDIIIMFVHWGQEYENYPSVSQRHIAQAMIDAGADGVIGHHPHVIQGVSVYKDKPIFYSMGNFIFDQYFSQETQKGYMVLLTIDSKNIEYEIVPYLSERSQPRVLSGSESELALLDIASVSDSSVRDTVSRGKLMYSR